MSEEEVWTTFAAARYASDKYVLASTAACDADALLAEFKKRFRTPKKEQDERPT
jgi:hypothetical protein